MADAFDTVIKGGLIVDGTGAPGFPGDIGISNGRIAAIGDLDAGAAEIIDATGQVVCPGFVDIHTHYDAQVFWDPTISPSSYHGVTTIIGGNCGFSIAPLSGKSDDADYLIRMLARVEGMPLDSLRVGTPWNWTSFGDYLGKLDGTLALNAGFMVGHSALRRYVMGDRAVGDRATDSEIAAMQALLRTSLAEGGLGFSSTISPSHNDGEGDPVPSRHAGDDELLALAGVLKDFEGTTLEFLPNVMHPFDDAQMQRMTDMSLAAGRVLNWNLLTPDSRTPERHLNQLAASDYAAARGAKVLALAAPRPPTIIVNLASGFIFDSFPGWAEIFKVGVPERIRLLSDPAVRARLGAAMRGSDAGSTARFADWGAWIIIGVASERYAAFQGKTVQELADSEGKAPFDAMLDLAVTDGLKTTFSPPIGGNDDATWTQRGEIWLDPRTIVGGSDAGAHLDMLDTFAFSTQVLGVGYRERGLLTLEQAIHQLTGVPASLYGLRDRGRVAPGYWADIVVLDAGQIGCGPVYQRHDLPADGMRLYADAMGIRHVLVNGSEIVRGCQFRGAFPGRILHSGRDTYTVSLLASGA